MKISQLKKKFHKLKYPFKILNPEKPSFKFLPKKVRMTNYESPLRAEDVRQICLNNGLEIHDTQWLLLEKWSDMLLDLNQEVNLISRKETKYLWEKHILSCLTLLILRKFSLDSEICDFGTGGGFPGMLLAIVRPDLQLTLFESRQKKVLAVQKMIETLKIPNVQIILGRGEELAKKRQWFKRFPYVTSRAVASSTALVNLTKDLRMKKSVLHLFKGGKIKDEILPLTIKFPGLKINYSLMNLNGYPKFAENNKFLISLEFYQN